jgi:hypothetical protein
LERITNTDQISKTPDLHALSVEILSLERLFDILLVICVFPECATSVRVVSCVEGKEFIWWSPSVVG